MAVMPTRWKAQNPNHIQLYSLATPNGKKVGIMLEEVRLPYEAHRIDIMEGDQFDPEFVAINPNSKIPAIIDPAGPNGEPFAIMESGAILHYLAEKTGLLFGDNGADRLEILQWMFFQAGSVGPMFGQFGHFYKHAKGKTNDYGEQRYGTEVTRLLGVLDRHLEGRDWLGKEYSIADIMNAPWMGALDFYECKDAVGWDDFKNVQNWVERFNEREAVQVGSKVCAID